MGLTTVVDQICPGTRTNCWCYTDWRLACINTVQKQPKSEFRLFSHWSQTIFPLIAYLLEQPHWRLEVAPEIALQAFTIDRCQKKIPPTADSDRLFSSILTTLRLAYGFLGHISQDCCSCYWLSSVPRKNDPDKPILCPKCQPLSFGTRMPGSCQRSAWWFRPGSHVTKV